MFYTIYQTINLIDDKVYIGKHQTNNLEDNYFGSGKHLNRAIKKYGKENFKKEILFIFSSEEEMNQKEAELVTEDFCAREDTYNIGLGGEGGPHFKGRKHSLETKEKIKNSSIGKIHTEQTLLKIAKKATGRKVSDLTKQKLSEASKKYYSNNILSKNTKIKISESLKGNKNTLGKFWITDGKFNKLISSHEEIPLNFVRGMTINKIKNTI